MAIRSQSFFSGEVDSGSPVLTKESSSIEMGNAESGWGGVVGDWAERVRRKGWVERADSELSDGFTDR